MCGIAGIIAADTGKVTTYQLKKMTDIIAHRGPDGEGHSIADNGNVGLGHRRLSIIDLSHEADQPMHYIGRYSIVFNGEIYNYIELKEELVLQGYNFKTASDTEVLMALYHKDKEACLQKLDGMFSFVIYDKQVNEIFAARDRFGEKPFFYSYKKGQHFLFGSEMKCLWAGGIDKQVNYRMLYNYLAFGLLDNPTDNSETFFENCTRLPHSHYLKLNVGSGELSIKKYYDIDHTVINHALSKEQAKEKFHELFYTSIKRRLRSDVIVGSSLSGGLDSSTVVTVIDELLKGTGQKQNTFSAVFPGFKKDERKYIDYVTAKTNVIPHFVTPDDEGLVSMIDKLSYHQEEPFNSASIYVQYCVMQLAKQNEVTVLLDGQGADELLAGYHAYYPSYFKELKRNDKILYRKEIAEYENMHGNSEINKYVRNNIPERIKTAIANNAPGLRKLYYHFKQIKDPFFNPAFYKAHRADNYSLSYSFDALNPALYSSSFKSGLQELLRYADRNSMAHSREVRLPFLYHELAEFLFSLPSHMKINNGWTKWILRESFAKELPPEITWRTDKIGYEPPQENWMRTTQVKDAIENATHKLVKNNIILPQHAMLQPANTLINWRLLMAGNLLP